MRNGVRIEWKQSRLMSERLRTHYICFWILCEKCMKDITVVWFIEPKSNKIILFPNLDTFKKIVSFCQPYKEVRNKDTTSLQQDKKGNHCIHTQTLILSHFDKNPILNI